LDIFYPTIYETNKKRKNKQKQKVNYERTRHYQIGILDDGKQQFYRTTFF